MQACSPDPITNADSFELIQRLATRFEKGLRRLPCEERLQLLGLLSLSRCRIKRGLLAAYKMFNGGLSLDPSLFFIPPVRQGLKRLALYADSVKIIEIVTPFLRLV